MDLIILYITLAIGSGLFFWKYGPFWTDYTKVDPNKKQKSHNTSFPGAWKKGATFKYDKNFKATVNKHGHGAWLSKKTKSK